MKTHDAKLIKQKKTQTTRNAERAPKAFLRENSFVGIYPKVVAILPFDPTTSDVP
jgi:hypothetical protein